MLGFGNCIFCDIQAENNRRIFEKCGGKWLFEEKPRYALIAVIVLSV